MLDMVWIFSTKEFLILVSSSRTVLQSTALSTAILFTVTSRFRNYWTVDIKIKLKISIFFNLRFNLICNWFLVKSVVFGKQIANQKPWNFTFNQLEMREIADIQDQDIMQILRKIQKWISRLNDRDYG